MRLRFIDRDGKKILQVAHDYHGYETWADVPCVEEKKEPRKLARILYETWSKNVVMHDAYNYWEEVDNNQKNGFFAEAKAAIDAVIECYEEWDDLFIKHRKPFPEYLKEKLGNE